MKEIEDRKKDHINLAEVTFNKCYSQDDRFVYHALSSFHNSEIDLSVDFLGHKLAAPIWISSMTGGSECGKLINENLSKVANKYKLGMGCGSIRPFVENSKLFDDFNIRQNLSTDQPFFANLGIAQVEKYINEFGNLSLVNKALDRLDATGLIIHINPLQEFVQPEGDSFGQNPIVTLKQAFDSLNYPVIVKEVGAGFSSRDMQSLADLPIKAIEFGAFGGTNFTDIELLRSSEVDQDVFESLVGIGHSALQMIDSANAISKNNDKLEFIISGGIRSFLDGYYLMDKLNKKSPYGFAYRFLKYAHSYDLLDEFLEKEIKGLTFAHQFLEVK